MSETGIAFISVFLMLLYIRMYTCTYMIWVGVLVWFSSATRWWVHLRYLHNSCILHIHDLQASCNSLWINTYSRWQVLNNETENLENHIIKQTQLLHLFLYEWVRFIRSPTLLCCQVKPSLWGIHKSCCKTYIVNICQNHAICSCWWGGIG